VNANNDPAGTTLDNDPLNQSRPGGGIYYLNVGYDGLRGGRITALIRAELAGDGSVSFADMQRIQADTALVDAQFFVPHLVRALARGLVDSDPTLRGLARDRAVAEAVGRLALWNRRTPTGIPEGYDARDENGRLLAPTRLEQATSVAATIYAVWRSQVIKGAIDARLAPFGVPVPDGERSLTALKHLLETFGETRGVGASGIDFFAVDGVADAADRRDVVLLSAVRAALAKLSGPDFQAAFGGSTDQADYRWGRLHRVVLDHPLGGPFNIPPAFGAFPPPLPDLPGIPTDGGFGTVDAASHDARADAATEFGFGSGPSRPPWPSCPAPTSRPPSAGPPTRATTAGAASTGSPSTTPLVAPSTSPRPSAPSRRPWPTCPGSRPTAASRPSTPPPTTPAPTPPASSASAAARPTATSASPAPPATSAPNPASPAAPAASPAPRSTSTCSPNG
ncbi:MAG TPA: penicillin acylase family protein, partial [Actinomycetota bacterium]|nr:penicillin acylase family protein [Actinomycetota bacterium]